MKTTSGCFLAVGLAASVSVSSLRAAESAMVNGDNVNVRGQPSLFSEVVTQVKKGETVQVIEKLDLEHPRAGDPSAWYKIRMPANTPLWVNSAFIDTNNAVTPLRLNIRAGAGENYSVVGRLERGQVVKPIRTVEDWVEVEGPTNAFAFIAADLVTIVKDAPAAAGAEKPAEVVALPPPTALTTNVEAVTNAPLPAVAPAETKPAEVEKPADLPPTAVDAKELEPVAAPVVPAADTNAAPAEALPVLSPPVGNPSATKEAATPPPAIAKEALTPPPITAKDALTPPPIAPPLAKVEEPLPKRVVTREGVVRGAVSIQSPTYFELRSTDTRKLLNYLHPMTTNLVVKKLRGKRVLVTGEEVMDVRWPSTPVINIQTLQILP